MKNYHAESLGQFASIFGAILGVVGVVIIVSSGQTKAIKTCRIRMARTVPIDVAKRARQILNIYKLGDEVIENDPRGKRWLYRVETHPPDAGIDSPHKGVTVFECV